MFRNVRNTLTVFKNKPDYLKTMMLEYLMTNKITMVLTCLFSCIVVPYDIQPVSITHEF